MEARWAVCLGVLCAAVFPCVPLPARRTGDKTEHGEARDHVTQNISENGTSGGVGTNDVYAVNVTTELGPVQIGEHGGGIHVSTHAAADEATTPAVGQSTFSTQAAKHTGLASTPGSLLPSNATPSADRLTTQYSVEKGASLNGSPTSLTSSLSAVADEQTTVIPERPGEWARWREKEAQQSPGSDTTFDYFSQADASSSTGAQAGERATHRDGPLVSADEADNTPAVFTSPTSAFSSTQTVEGITARPAGEAGAEQAEPADKNNADVVINVPSMKTTFAKVFVKYKDKPSENEVSPQHKVISNGKPNQGNKDFLDSYKQMFQENWKEGMIIY